MTKTSTTKMLETLWPISLTFFTARPSTLLNDCYYGSAYTTTLPSTITSRTGRRKPHL
jgi:hypothetical protein